MATKKTTKKKAKKSAAADKDFCQYKHRDKRLNNPPVGLVTPESDCQEDKAVYRYDPHLDPELQFDSQRASIEKLIDNALASDDKDALKQALKELKRLQEPYLNWTGKAELIFPRNSRHQVKSDILNNERCFNDKATQATYSRIQARRSASGQ